MIERMDADDAAAAAVVASVAAVVAFVSAVVVSVVAVDVDIARRRKRRWKMRKPTERTMTSISLFGRLCDANEAAAAHQRHYFRNRQTRLHRRLHRLRR